MKTVIIDGNELTYQQAHYMLWNWLAEHTNCNKKYFFDTHKCSEVPYNLCFACEECEFNCAKCKIYDCFDNGFNDWHSAFHRHDEVATRIYALQIRDAWK